MSEWVSENDISVTSAEYSAIKRKSSKEKWLFMRSSASKYAGLYCILSVSGGGW